MFSRRFDLIRRKLAALFVAAKLNRYDIPLSLNK